MKKTSGHESHSHILIIAILLVAMAVIQLFITFQGLSDPVAMDQAQIGRQIAQGQGFTTKFIRPIALSKNYGVAEMKAKIATAQAQAQAKAEGRETADINIPPQFSPLAMKDTNNAPLNVLFDAAALRLSGAHNFDSWKMEQRVYVYAPDRIIALVSLIFFLLSIWAIYHLCKRIFDVSVASITCILLILSELFLQLSVSGLPQMMMLFFSTLGANFLYTAITRQLTTRKKTLVPIIVSGFFFTLVALSGWIGVWVFLGFLLFVGIYFRPHGLLCIPPIALFLLLVGVFLQQNNAYSGNPFGIAVFSIYDGIVNSSNAIMRAMSQRDIPIDPQTLLTHIIGSSLRQVNNLYTNMGGIVITPFFFLALLHPFKNKATDAFKWAVFLIWVFSTIGMALYTPENEPAYSASQLQILSTPFFTAFALALLFVMIGRLNSSHANIKGLRPFVIAIVILASSASLIMSLPKELKQGLATELSGLPHWPPYFPPGLNVGLNNQSSPDKVIASDQPWAVAWYANRPSMWIPKKKEMFFSAEEILKKNNTSIGGILITPTSYSDPEGIRGITENYGDFADFVLEGAIIKLFPTYQTYLSTMSSRASQRDPLTARFAHATSRLRLFGPDVMYYSETPVKEEQ